jgi:Flp pilus assembly protein CpaB
MKPKTMILMGLAIVCGLGASYMTSRLLAERQTPEEEKIEILVAKKNLSVGERILVPEEFFERKPVVKADEPPDAIKDFDALKGKVMRQSRNRGDHITPSNLYDRNRLDIPEGTQAVGLPVNLATTAHGLATLPGSRVDLMLTVRGKDAQSTISKIVVQNALVLAADGRVDREGDLIAPASVVTLALNTKDRLIATNAKEMGILTLSLRKLDENVVTKNTNITGDVVLNGEKKDEPVAPPPPIEPPPPTVVEPPLPSGTPGRLNILNGRDTRSVRYRTLENGDVEYDDEENPRPALQPAPRPQPQPQPGPTGKGRKLDL